MTIPVYPNNTPTKPGRYLFQGRFTSTSQLVNVYLRHCEPYGGATNDPYLAASGHSTAIERWDGYWSEEIEVNVAPVS